MHESMLKVIKIVDFLCSNALDNLWDFLEEMEIHLKDYFNWLDNWIAENCRRYLPNLDQRLLEMNGYSERINVLDPKEKLDLFSIMTWPEQNGIRNSEEVQNYLRKWYHSLRSNSLVLILSHALSVFACFWCLHMEGSWMIICHSSDTF